MAICVLRTGLRAVARVLAKWWPARAGSRESGAGWKLRAVTRRLRQNPGGAVGVKRYQVSK